MDGLFEEYDIALEKIQSICFSYMTNGDVKTDYVELISMQACLESMKEDIQKLQASLDIQKDNSDYFRDAKKSLTQITLSDSVDSYSYVKPKHVLKTTLALLLKNINMCFGIIRQMLSKV